MQKPASDGRLLHLDLSKNGVKKNIFLKLKQKLFMSKRNSNGIKMLLSHSERLKFRRTEQLFVGH
jgi:hypothetical protein